MKKAFLISLFLTVISIPVFTQSIAEQTKMREAIEREIALLDKQLITNKSQQKTSTKELSLIQQKITNRRKLLSQIENDITYIDKQSSQKEGEIKKLNLELEKLKERYSHLVYSSYKNRDKTVWILYILASKNVEQGYRRWSYLRNYSGALKVSAASIREKSVTLQEEMAKLIVMREESLNMKKQREQEYRSLAMEEKTAKSIVTQLSRKEREFRNQINNKRREVEKLNREIERILAQATQEKSSAGAEEIAAARVLSNKFENNKGKLPWPVKEGVVIEAFGQHNHPVFKHIKLPFNNGVNISTSLNAQVLAVFDGVVKQILVMPGYNQCVLVQHGNYYTFYTKIEKVRVTTGDKVATGEVIGTLTESEGNSILHFQLWHGTDKQNPEHWISK